MSHGGWAEHAETVWAVRRPDPERAAALATEIGVSPLVGQILLHRGHTTPEEARAFLSPALDGLLPPERLPDMGAAVDRILRAVRGGERIAVFGDYDVDGITGTALLTLFLESLGATVRPYLPDRRSEGYGLNLEAVARLVTEGTGLLVAVDHGTTAVAEIRAARDAGLDVVVLDHHVPAEERPPAVALVNPHLTDYPEPHPCGVGVAFKLVWAAAQALSGGPRVSLVHREFLAEALGLVALGTVSDVVPLRGENRIFTRFGLPRLATARRPGLRALREVAGILKREPTAGDVGYKLAPRLNAAGRMGHAELALELFLTEDPGRADEIARTLDRENLRRRAVEKEIFSDACRRVEEEVPPGHPGALILGSEDWHAGVIGIVASRLVERYHRPAVLVAFENGRGRGSCRSISGVPLPEVLERAAEHLESWGGHARAAGLTVLPDRFPAFREALDRAVRDRVRPEDLVARIRVDAIAPLSAVTPALVRDLERLAPFGEGNPRPTFGSRGVRFAGRVRRMGKSGEHLSANLTDGGSALRAVGFGMGAREALLERAGDGVDIAYTPRFDEWRGDGSVELGLKDLLPSHGRSRD